MFKLTAQLVSAEPGRGQGNALVTTTLEFDDDMARIYAERLAEGDADKWLAEHAEVALLKKCRVTYRLEHAAPPPSQP